VPTLPEADPAEPPGPEVLELLQPLGGLRRRRVLHQREAEVDAARRKGGHRGVAVRVQRGVRCVREA
jgi:hypothetical protein